MTYIQSIHNRAVTYAPTPKTNSIIATVLHWVAVSDRQFRQAQKRVDATADHF
ncbi:hypothetical protein [Falsiphaeobacter marinintestinus]|uniref:hypothetical protein n=1 Tax=Falsiphaeobacter marinintestinus TaxID=1492905 RepID=UPI0016469297|nr:hypothetical protein [Phaeobacter marinintestinus]